MKYASDLLKSLLYALIWPLDLGAFFITQPTSVSLVLNEKITTLSVLLKIQRTSFSIGVFSSIFNNFAVSHKMLVETTAVSWHHWLKTLHHLPPCSSTIHSRSLIEGSHASQSRGNVARPQVADRGGYRKLKPILCFSKAQVDPGDTLFPSADLAQNFCVSVQAFMHVCNGVFSFMIVFHESIRPKAWKQVTRKYLQSG